MDKTFTPAPGRLMNQVRETLRYFHYSYSTEKSYIHWILRYIRFNDRRHPRDMGKPEIERFLSHLAIIRKASLATQNQAFNAILFLNKTILKSSSGTNPDKLKNVRSKVLNQEYHVTSYV